MQRTVLFLDVDGVLSPFSRAVPDWFTDWEEPPEFGFYAPVSLQMAERILSWRVEIVWLTTWQNLANELIVPIFGWEPKETLVRKGFSKTCTGWWKLDAAMGWFNDNPVDRLIWLDDDLEEEFHNVTTHLEIPSEQRLLISPDRNTGLSPDDLQGIEDWLEETKED
jgi:hypothetical protein